MEGGYKCLRQPMEVHKPEDKFIPVFEYKWKPDELPSAYRNSMLDSLESEFTALQEGKPRAIGIQHNTLDVFMYFAKVDTSVYLASVHAYTVRRQKNEKNEIAEFINNLALQLRLFG
jgi:hypothetical protein